MLPPFPITESTNVGLKSWNVHKNNLQLTKLMILIKNMQIPEACWECFEAAKIERRSVWQQWSKCWSFFSSWKWTFQKSERQYFLILVWPQDLSLDTWIFWQSSRKTRDKPVIGYMLTLRPDLMKWKKTKYIVKVLLNKSCNILPHLLNHISFHQGSTDVKRELKKTILF